MIDKYKESHLGEFFKWLNTDNGEIIQWTVIGGIIIIGYLWFEYVYMKKPIKEDDELDRVLDRHENESEEEENFEG